MNAAAAHINCPDGISPVFTRSSDYPSRSPTKIPVVGWLGLRGLEVPVDRPFLVVSSETGLSVFCITRIDDIEDQLQKGTLRNSRSVFNMFQMTILIRCVGSLGPAISQVIIIQQHLSNITVHIIHPTCNERQGIPSPSADGSFCLYVTCSEPFLENK